MVLTRDRHPDLWPAGPRSPRDVLRIIHRPLGNTGDARRVVPTFESLKADGAHLVELDVRTTADDQLVVCHDAFLVDRHGAHRWVADTSLVELETVLPRYVSADVALRAASDCGLGIYWDIKKLTQGGAQSLAGSIAAFEMERSCILSSYRVDIMHLCANMMPQFPRSVMFFSEQHEDPVELASAAGVHFVHPTWERHDRPDRFLNQSWIARVWSRGLGVIGWSDARRSVIDALYAHGVDGLQADDPGLLMQAARLCDEETA